MIAAGLGVGGWLVGGPVRLGHVTLDVHTLFFAGIAVLLGYQAVLFAAFSRVYAANAGLIPQHRLLDRLLDILSLEVGLVAGGLLLFVGLAGSSYSVILWNRHSLGPMDPTQLLRIVIPSGVCLALGFQTILSSFFLSVLGLGLKGPADGLPER